MQTCQDLVEVRWLEGRKIATDVARELLEMLHGNPRRDALTVSLGLESRNPSRTTQRPLEAACLEPADHPPVGMINES